MADRSGKGNRNEGQRPAGLPAHPVPSGERLKKIYDHLPDGVATLSEEGFILSANPSLCSICGWEFEALRKRHFLSFFLDGCRDELLRAFNCALGGEPQELAAELHRGEEGAKRTVSITLVPTDGDDSEKMVAIFRDISSGALIGSRAQVSEKRYQSLVDQCPDGVFSCLFDGTLISWNAMAERILGWKASEVMPLRLGAQLKPFPEAVIESWLTGSHAKSLREGAPTKFFETQCWERWGSPRNALVRLIPRMGDCGQITGFTAFLRDITEQKRMELTHAESLGMYRTMVECSSDIIFQMLPDLTLLYINPAVKTILGYDPADWMHRKVPLELFLAPEEVALLNAYGLANILKEGFKNRPFKIFRPDRSGIWGLMSLVPVTERGELKTVLGMIRDVTQMYEATEAIMKQQESLKNAVEQLQAANTLQEQFLSNITHEIRTPLTTIIVTSELLEKEVSQSLTPAHQKQMKLLYKNSTALLALINDLLDMAKLKRCAFEVQSKEFQLDEFIRSINDLIGPLFAQKKIAFTCDVEGSAPRSINTDEGLLRRVVLNILHNAYKFTEEGSVKLEVGLEEPWLCLVIRDTGIGIAPAEIPAIFDEFRQIDGSDSRRYPGTGLGLAIADKLTRLLGGKIEVESEVGRGSAFKVFIPRMAPRY